MNKTELTVSGKRYSLHCTPGKEQRLVMLGQRFDARVAELIDALGDIGAERLFLAAGISLLDELESAQNRPAPPPAPVSADDANQRIKVIERLAAAALSDAADRILALSERVDEVG